jgi:hypothetical protein
MSKIWIVGQMCVGKTYYSKVFGDLIGYKPFHLDHIPDLPLVEAYKKALEHDLIEGFTPLRDDNHWQAIQKALKGYKVKHILVAPDYSQWLENCKPIIADPNSINPPNYTKIEYEQENDRIAQLVNPIFIIR